MRVVGRWESYTCRKTLDGSSLALANEFVHFVRSELRLLFVPPPSSKRSNIGAQTTLPRCVEEEEGVPAYVRREGKKAPLTFNTRWKRKVERPASKVRKIGRVLLIMEHSSLSPLACTLQSDRTLFISKLLRGRIFLQKPTISLIVFSCL